MNIAYVSFEYPPDTAVGGIATYVYQVSRMMHMRGHHVSVFCASPTRTVSENVDGITVHRIQTEDRLSFPQEILPLFEKQYAEQPYDILESPEYSGDGYEIKKRFPQLPLVVKLHTPTSFIRELDTFYKSATLSTYTKFRFLLGGWIRGELRERYWDNRKWKSKKKDIDYQITALADEIHTPSVSLGNIVSKKWNIARSQIFNVPYPFVPNVHYLNVMTGSTGINTITYVGRLETRKGLVELTKALPAILDAVPDAQIQFVGKDMHSILPGVTMREYIEAKLVRYKDRLRFLKVTPDQIPDVLKSTAVCVFPSIWENFPNVCLEAMSAGRAIVASAEGGMKDMLDDVKAGTLINPLQPHEIASAVVGFLKNPELQVKAGEAARKKVLTAYNSDVIGNLMEQRYLATIGKRHNA